MLDNLKVEIVEATGWLRAINAGRMTIGKDKKPYLNELTGWKTIERMLKGEHSPIRLREYDITLHNVPYRVMVHLVRHKIGVEFYVCSSRDDRANNEIPQSEQTKDTPLTMMISANAQALINMAGMRLCNNAMEETRLVMDAIRDKMLEVDPLMAKYMVPRCVKYRGCPEPNCCCKKVDPKYYAR